VLATTLYFVIPFLTWRPRVHHLRLRPKVAHLPPPRCCRPPVTVVDDRPDQTLKSSIWYAIICETSSADGSNNTRRKAAFAAAAYKDSEVLKSYFGDANQVRDGGRQSVIEVLDLGNNELRKEVEILGDIMPFKKYDPAKNGDFEFDGLDMDHTLSTIQERAPLLLQIIRGIMAPKSQRVYQRQKEPAARIVTIISILCFSQRQNTCTGFQTTLGLYLHSNGLKRQQIELLSRLGLVVSYQTVARTIKEQSAQAAEHVKNTGQSDA